MPIRKIMIDEDVAQQGEQMAELLGHQDLEHYIMHLIVKDAEDAMRRAKKQNLEQDPLMRYGSED